MNWRSHMPLVFALLLLQPLNAVASADTAKHTGVATCASSVCHGRLSPSGTSYAALNEYRVWAGEDLHAKAYAILENDHSKRIARNMGIGDPTTEDVCLDCHSDNVPPEQRGDKFSLSDGVGCEACHGAAEHWISGHDDEDANHEKNVALGMFPAGEPVFQAQLCLSCHMGNADKMATHEIMAAGHPRLRFELDTYLASMPRHHVIDADYVQRKGERETADRWATGILMAARGFVDNLLSHRFAADNLAPELSMFDCHGCHRPMDLERRRSATDRILPAGAVRLNDNALKVLPLIVELRDPALAKRLEKANATLHKAALQGVSAVKAKAKALRTLTEQAEQHIVGKRISDKEIIALRKSLLKKAGKQHFNDYADAEQLFMSLEVLTVALDSPDYPLEDYDKLFSLLEDEAAYNAARYAREARRILGR